MSEMMETPIGEMPAEKKGSKTWLIVLIVVIVLCCFCGGLAALAWFFGDSVMNALQMAALGAA